MIKIAPKCSLADGSCCDRCKRPTSLQECVAVICLWTCGNGLNMHLVGNMGDAPSFGTACALSPSAASSQEIWVISGTTLRMKIRGYVRGTEWMHATKASSALLCQCTAVRACAVSLHPCQASKKTQVTHHRGRTSAESPRCEARTAGGVGS